MRPEDLSVMQLDALRELSSIGTAHAATALSQLVGRAVEITVPDMRLLRVTEVPKILGGPEEVVAAAYFRLLGEISGSLLFVAPEDTARALTDELHGREPGTTEMFGHEEQSQYLHIAFVQATAYLAAVSRMMNVNVLPSPPQFALDMAGAILQIAVSRIGMRADTALVVSTRFVLEDNVVDANLLFLPDPDSLDILLGRLGLG